MMHSSADDRPAPEGSGLRGAVAEPSAELVLAGGRVIDPETGHDAIGDVGISGDRIVAVGTTVRATRARIDCRGLVVCPGFIDLHSHAQSLAGARLQALDGVTTALDLECGATGVAELRRRAAREGRPIHYGYSASWALARAAVLDPRANPPAGHDTGFAAFQAWTRSSPVRRDLGRDEYPALLDRLAAELAEGALGVGAMLGYLPETPAAEFEAVARAAADAGVVVSVHARSSARSGPVTALDAVEELVGVGARTGARLHLCHLNSTSSSWLPEIIDALDSARDDGLPISTEAYPYSRGSTVIGASFLSPEELAREGRGPDSLTYLATGESIADADRLAELRRTDPAGLVLTTSYDESDPAEAALLDRALALPAAAFASDAIPALPTGLPADRWPLPPEAVAHPRSAGCFSRVLSSLVRDRGLLSLPEAIRRCTLVPARIAAPSAPCLGRKGRVRPGADADLVAFDPERIADRATYTELHPSTGVRHLIVAGTPVVRDGRLLLAAAPGRAITNLDRPTDRPDRTRGRRRRPAKEATWESPDC
jgi:imidazolonepropionase-like amidohydrolase